jgi:adenylyltransferase/sulfurtransferase
VVYCKTGARSAQAARIMQAAGLRVRNLRGGINAWSREVDPNVPLY